MTAPLTLTVVIRDPVYTSLAAELSTQPDARARAGWLKRLAEEGARASCANSHGHARDVPQVPLSQPAGSCNQVFDMRVTIREEEFPNLYAVLMGQQNPRARAALLKRFAAEALRWADDESAAVSAEPRHPQTHAPPATESVVPLNSLSLPPGALPADFLAGMVVLKSVG
jgi:hypothetical protein